jgi:hypothetical protein
MYWTQVFEEGAWRNFWPCGDNLKSAKKSLDHRRKEARQSEEWRLVRYQTSGKTQVIKA